MYGIHTNEQLALPDGTIRWLIPLDFSVLSIGTGNYKAEAPQGNGSAIGVVNDLVTKILMGGASDLVHSYFRALMVSLVAISAIVEWG
jgi:hypothetical protein